MKEQEPGEVKWLNQGYITIVLRKIGLAQSNQGSKNWFIMAPVQSQWSNLQRLSRCDAVSKAFVQAVFWDGQGLWAGNLPGDISQVA